MGSRRVVSGAPEWELKKIELMRAAVYVSAAALLGQMVPLAYRIAFSDGAALEDAFLLETPRSGDVLSTRVRVSGHTRLGDRSYYIVVTTPQGTNVLQDAVLSASGEGLLEGTAMIGSSQEGAGELYRIRLLATRNKLVSGPMVNVPTDAEFSNSATVVRSVEPGGDK